MKKLLEKALKLLERGKSTSKPLVLDGLCHPFRQKVSVLCLFSSLFVTKGSLSNNQSWVECSKSLKPKIILYVV